MKKNKQEVEERKEAENEDPISEEELKEQDPGPPSNPLLLSGLDFHVLSLLTVGSIFGCLARLGLTALFSAPNQSTRMSRSSYV